jgi:hypothetical protein
MRNLLLASLLGLLTACATGTAPRTRPVALFDGKSFAGWEGNRQIFRIQDGAIVGGSLKDPIPHNDFLCTTRQYTNFVLRVKLKLLGGEKANAGIQIRSQRIPNHFEVIGYQADVGQQYWGALYDESRRKVVLVAPKPEDLPRIVRHGEWNDYEIRCVDRRITLKLNGHTTVDYTEPDATIPQYGLIAVQIHSGPPSEAWYKDIVIQELP